MNWQVTVGLLGALGVVTSGFAALLAARSARRGDKDLQQWEAAVQMFEPGTPHHSLAVERRTLALATLLARDEVKARLPPLIAAGVVALLTGISAPLAFAAEQPDDGALTVDTYRAVLLVAALLVVIPTYLTMTYQHAVRRRAAAIVRDLTNPPSEAEPDVAES